MLATFGYFARLSAYCFNTERYKKPLPTKLQNPGTIISLMEENKNVIISSVKFHVQFHGGCKLRNSCTQVVQSGYVCTTLSLCKSCSFHFQVNVAWKFRETTLLNVRVAYSFYTIEFTVDLTLKYDLCLHCFRLSRCF